MNEEIRELLEKAAEYKQEIAEAIRACDRAIADLEEELEEPDAPEEIRDPEDDADWIIIF